MYLLVNRQWPGTGPQTLVLPSADRGRMRRWSVGGQPGAHEDLGATQAARSIRGLRAGRSITRLAAHALGHVARRAPGGGPHVVGARHRPGTSRHRRGTGRGSAHPAPARRELHPRDFNASALVGRRPGRRAHRCRFDDQRVEARPIGCGERRLAESRAARDGHRLRRPDPPPATPARHPGRRGGYLARAEVAHSPLPLPEHARHQDPVMPSHQTFRSPARTSEPRRRLTSGAHDPVNPL